MGLGNPSRGSERQRHNLGYMVVDAYAAARGLAWVRQGAMEMCADNEVVLVKPLTGMNDSGLVFMCRPLVGTPAARVVVVHDEMELPPGEVRWRTGGSHKGHNGLKSVMTAVGPEFHRVRVGIGRPVGRSVIDHVLGEVGAEAEGLVTDAVRLLKAYVESP